MNETTEKEVLELIELNDITDPCDERIESDIADKFPDEYSNDQEYVDFQIEIAEMVNKTKTKSNGTR